MENEKQTIHVMEYQVRDTKDYRYVANFEYQGIHYRLKGIMKRSDFEEILKICIILKFDVSFSLLDCLYK